MINEETISSLLKIYKDDEKILNTIERCLISFEEFPIVKDTTPNITNSRLNNIP